MMEINITTYDRKEYDIILKSLSTNNKLKLNGMECYIKTASFAPPFDVNLTLILPNEEVKLE